MSTTSVVWFDILRSDSGEIYEGSAKGICINFSRGPSLKGCAEEGKESPCKMTSLLLLLGAKSKEN